MEVLDLQNVQKYGIKYLYRMIGIMCQSVQHSLG